MHSNKKLSKCHFVCVSGCFGQLFFLADTITKLYDVDNGTMIDNNRNQQCMLLFVIDIITLNCNILLPLLATISWFTTRHILPDDLQTFCTNWWHSTSKGSLFYRNYLWKCVRSILVGIQIYPGLQ